MKTILRTTQFKKDVKRLQKRGNDMELLKEVIVRLVSAQSLAEKHRDHALIGNYVATRECHIKPDWLLIYQSADDEITLIRTGSHADLFE